MICPECEEAICTGCCRHATEFFEVEPKFWNEDDVDGRGSLAVALAKEKIKAWNEYGRKRREGCLGVLGKEEI